MKGDAIHNNEVKLLEIMLYDLKTEKMTLIEKRNNIEQRIRRIHLQENGLRRIHARLQEEGNASN